MYQISLTVTVGYHVAYGVTWPSFSSLLQTRRWNGGLLLSWAKIERFRGQIQISNAFDGSQVLINPAIPEVDKFKNIKDEEITIKA